MEQRHPLDFRGYNGGFCHVPVGVRPHRPWLAVLALEIVNEWSDLQAEKWPDAGIQYGNAANDILLTMLLPTLILAVGRIRPELLVEQVPRSVDKEPG